MIASTLLGRPPTVESPEKKGRVRERNNGEKNHTLREEKEEK